MAATDEAAAARVMRERLRWGLHEVVSLGGLGLGRLCYHAPESPLLTDKVSCFQATVKILSVAAYSEPSHFSAVIGVGGARVRCDYQSQRPSPDSASPLPGVPTLSRPRTSL